MIAMNAQPILNARLRGLRPDEMVMISLIGQIGSPNKTVYADTNTVYDWRWVRGLDICVWIGDEPNWALTLKAIALCRPEYLAIWNQRHEWGAKVYLIPTAADVTKPICMWEYELDVLDWLETCNRVFSQ